MSDELKRFGRDAETAAEGYLKRRGYRIVERNLRTHYGELDLVAEWRGVLVFVEVKARHTGHLGGAVQAVDERKQSRLIRLAADYIGRRRLKQPLCRFDVLLCHGDPTAPGQIEHIENAFEVPGDDLRW